MSLPALAVLDLFAGPGGWDFTCRVLGLDPLGIEWDAAACATRAAAGLRTEQADVAALDPAEFGPCDLLIASPPCPSFSRAGLRRGLDDLPLIHEAAKLIAAGKPLPEGIAWHDERSALVLEPLRWALALKPRWLAWEQVPDVLPFWQECARLLRAAGWNVWTGILEAERYGVPQTRERAILMADREAHVHPPRPTHQRYVKGEPQRHEHTLEGEVLPWVSMAQALGWDEGIEPSPAPTVTGGGTGAGGGVEVFASRWPRERVKRAIRNGNQENATECEIAEPAPTIAFGHNAASIEWTHGRIYDRRQTSGKGEPVGPRAASDPAPTLTAQGLAKGRDVWRREWGGDGPQPHESPATTVAGDPRLSSRSHHNHGEQNGHAIRVSLEEAAMLQSFPPDYPFDGLARPPHISRSPSVEDDQALAHQLVCDQLKRVVHFSVLPLAGQDDEIVQAVVVADTVDVMHDLLRLRVGDHAVLRIKGAASEDVAAPSPGLPSGSAALVCVERITMQPPLLPVTCAQSTGDGLAFAMLARPLRWTTSEAEGAVASPLVVHEAHALGSVGPLATFDLAEAHRVERYREAGTTKTKRFEQVGNAVPPLLARAVLRQLLR